MFGPIKALFTKKQMKVVLVNPPRSCHDLAELSAPLGLLKLASISAARGADTSIVDFNLIQHLNSDFAGSGFYESALQHLLEKDGDVYGFTSMAVDSHISLRLAQMLKVKKRDAVTVFGGSHFSSIATDLTETYEWVDFVVKGEGEDSFDQLLKQPLRRLRKSRTAAERVLSFQSTNNLSSFPGYEFVKVDDYFAVNSRRVLDYEGGRGCRFKCAFCYSPGHYSRVRSFSIDQRLAELNLLTQLGAAHVFFVEDNFLNNPTETAEFCRELEKARLGLTWSCYATLPQADTQVLSLMARAGCRSIFMGIDAVGSSSEKHYKKNFLHRKSLIEVVAQCRMNDIRPTCAFMLSPPSHYCGRDIEATLSSALAARNAGADIRLNTLTLYNGTDSYLELHEQAAADTSKVNLLLDLPQDLEINQYATERPWLFPFHSRYVAQGEWSTFLQTVHCLFTLFYCYPRELQDLWLNSNLSPVRLAQAVLEHIGDLSQIDKVQRRSFEVSAFDVVMRKLSLSDLKQFPSNRLVCRLRHDRQANSLEVC
jgi:Radical SAM superfamily/B12 binding domain